MKSIIDDGFSSYLVKGAEFVGKYQIPALKEENILLPNGLVAFNERKKAIDKEHKALHFYMHDIMFKQVLNSTSRYLDEFKEFGYIITPDCSLYLDQPLCIQIINTYFNRAIGHYLQQNNLKVIPNVRWGDKRSFEFCFDGIPKNGIVSVSTLGCIRTQEEKYYFKLGFDRMIKIINPKAVIVHGDYPNEVFSEFEDKVKIVNFQSSTAIRRRKLYGK
jgi:hypothetical protein